MANNPGSQQQGLLLMVWGCGSRLGLRDCEARSEPTAVPHAPCGTMSRKVFCGPTQMVTLSDGQDYEQNEQQGGPSSGHDDVYAWGSDRCLLTNGNSDVPAKIVALSEKNITQIDCATDHGIAVSKNGDVYKWGSEAVADYGQQADNGSNEGTIPKHLASLAGVHVVQLACGEFHSACISITGMLYTWGNKNAIGHGPNHSHQINPLRIDGLSGKRMVKLSAGHSHTAAISSEGELYTWGVGADGRLGHGLSVYHCYTPTPVAMSDGRVVRMVSCGGYHTALVADDRRLYTFGDGEFGQLGHGDLAKQYTPKPVSALEGLVISDLDMGSFHSVCVTASGCCYAWGNNGHGRLGIGPGPKKTGCSTLGKEAQGQLGSSRGCRWQSHCGTNRPILTSPSQQ